MRQVILRFIIAAERLAVLDAFDNADDFPPLLFSAQRDAGFEMFAERIFAGKMLLRESLVDDDDRQRIGFVTRSEIAPGQQRNLHCREVVVADDAKIRARLFAFGNVPAFDLEGN